MKTDSRYVKSRNEKRVKSTREFEMTQLEQIIVKEIGKNNVCLLIYLHKM